MNKYGFFIKSLELCGDEVETVKINFNKGLNVIYGDSDTGKTFIYECIDYMLGASKIPKVSIDEAKGYTSSILEIESIESQTSYILERSLKGGDIIIKSLDKVLIVNNQSKQETISDFLLKLCNIENKKIRKNTTGETENLYFQSLKRLFLVDEVKIIIEKSLIIREEPTYKTKDKNLFKFILSDEDDSNIITLITKNETINKKAKIEVYTEILLELKNELPQKNNEDIIEKIKYLDKEIELFEEKHKIEKNKFEIEDEKKNSLYKEKKELKSELIKLEETLQRSFILNKQYDSDIERLKASIEAGQFFDLFSTSSCPICNSKINTSQIVNYQTMLTASTNEIKKTIMLKKELIETQKIFNRDKIELSDKLSIKEKNYRELLDKIKNDFNSQLEEISTYLKKISIERATLIEIKVLQEKFNSYTKKQKDIQKIIDDNKDKKTNYIELSTELFLDINEKMENILKEIKFDREIKVTYSEKDSDFIIGKQKRGDFGKGYRAILYAVFVISMLEYLRDKTYQIGFTMIDSPLNPYKKNDEDDNYKIDDNLANNFYRYLAKNIKDEQVILIENTPIPNDIKVEVNYIQFTKGNGFLKGNKK